MRQSSYMHHRHTVRRALQSLRSLSCLSCWSKNHHQKVSVYESSKNPSMSLRVHVPNKHILTQNLFHNYYYPNPRYLNIWVLGPSVCMSHRLGKRTGMPREYAPTMGKLASMEICSVQCELKAKADTSRG